MAQSEPSGDHRDVLDNLRVGIGSLLAEMVQHKNAAVAVLPVLCESNKPTNY